MSFVAGLLAVTLALYGAFFYLLAMALGMGTPVDAMWAAVHRTWLGAAGTLAQLVLFIFLKLADVSTDSNLLAGTIVSWALRCGIWTWVVTRVYRVTRWRKGKLAISVAAGLGLNLGLDLALAKVGSNGAFLPSFGSWIFRLV